MGTHGNDPAPNSAERVRPDLPRGEFGTPAPGVATQPLGDGAPAAAPVGDAAGRYQLLDEIARGGMGVVYRATDAALGREVAVKVLREQIAPDSAIARRFVDEARIAGQLQHPGIPPMHDVGAGSDGRPFLVMKLIKGRTLDQLLQDRPDPTADRGRFVAIFEQVCQAVAYAHAHKVIHRDLKPHNVMVGAFAEVQVMDWGLAKVLSGSPRPASPADETVGTEIRSLREDGGAPTHAGSVLGTPAFMAPEQAVGAVDQVDEQSDVFGLGGLLAVILTGRPPFAGDTAESTRLLAARGKVEDCFGRLDGCGAEPDLVALCKRCLAPEKADRPRNAGEVAQAVAALRAAADERARQAELDRVRAEGERAKAEAEAREQRKRRRVQAALGTALLVAVAVVALVLSWEQRQAADRERQRAGARDAARQGLESALDRAAAAFPPNRLADVDAALDRAAELLDAAEAPDLRQRYDDLRADRATVAELDRVWARANAIVDERVPGVIRRAGDLRADEEAARAGYAAALTARGLTVGPAGVEGAAALIARSAARDRFIAALDDWLPLAAPADRPWLCDLLARLDPDAERNDIRRAYAEPERLRTLFSRPPSEGALRLAARAAISPAVPDAPALPVLRAAVVRHPDDFLTQHAAGLRTVRANPLEAAGYFQAASSLRPNNLAAVYNLGVAWHQSGRPQEAAPHYLRAIELDPGYASAYLNLADVIKMGADPAPAVAYFRRQIEQNDGSAMAHFGLGMALRDRDPKAAATAFRDCLARDDTLAIAHNYLGYVLHGLRQRDECMRCYRRAIELDPTFAFPHYNLGLALRENRDVAGAIAEFRTALKLFPEHTWSHLELGRTLAAKREWREAADHLRRVIEIDPSFGEGYYLLGQVLLADGKAAEAADVYRRYVRQYPNLPLAYDSLLLALVRKGENAAAVRAYYEAVSRANPTWPDAVRRNLRYNAACAAVLAGTGAGQDAPAPADRVAFRQQALGWLRAEFESYKKDSEAQPASRPAIREKMKHWLSDGDLAPTREPAALAQLPQAERDAWIQLWADVRRLQADTAPPRPTK